MTRVSRAGASKSDPRVSFDTVLTTETAFLRDERDALRTQSRPPEAFPVGLALSGGGIRSATFSLGVLQALASLKLLRRFDYLSTVSGGGYAGSWLSAWIKREGLTTVEDKLGKSAASSDAEPIQLQWLRRYSNYLTPRLGVLSADTLTVVAIFCRNLLLNALILFFLTSSLLLLPLLALRFAYALVDPSLNRLLGAGATVIGGTALGLISLPLTLQSTAEIDKYKSWLKSGWVIAGIVLPVALAAALGSFWLIVTDFSKPPSFLSWVSSHLPGGSELADLADRVAEHMGTYAVAFGLFAIAVPGLLMAGFWVIARSLRNDTGRDSGGSASLRGGETVTFVSSFLISVVVGLLLCCVWTLKWNFFLHDSPQWKLGLTYELAKVLTFAPPLMIAAFFCVSSLFIGLVGRTYQERSREWWARLHGHLLVVCVAWLAICALAFYVPPLLAYVHHRWHTWAAALAGMGWLGSLVVAFLGKNLKPSPDARSARWQVVGVKIATAIVATGIFVAIASLQGYLLGKAVSAAPLGGASFTDHVSRFMQTRLDAFIVGLPAFLDTTVFQMGPMWLPVFFGAVFALACAMAWRVDINKFSLQNMYKNRLTRCYLGASNAKRTPQPFTGLDPHDDVDLKDLGQRPLHIVNTAMNLVQGADLAWQQRKAASFSLTPLHCGYKLSGQQGSLRVDDRNATSYVRTNVYARKDPAREDRGFSLGMAMATSGAAASPNMGFLSTPALAVIMTFFNVRLGRWSPNPSGNKYDQTSPKFGLGYLLAELTGNTNELSDFVYLSDGGHFENTAVYELIRRQCPLIVMVDAGADPERKFADLANLQRKVRVDFGYEVELPTNDLRCDDPNRLPASGFAVGHVRYSEESRGTIVLIKPTMCHGGLESVDLQNYRAEHPDFPQQATADQWFDESQFESYRKLGFELGCKCFNDAAVARLFGQAA